MGATSLGPNAVAAADAGDEVLVARTERGDRAAFDELYRRHGRPAWRVALAVGGGVAAAEQAVAEGFTAALRQHRSGAAAGFGLPFRLLVVRATVEAAGAEAGSGVAPKPDPSANEAVAALRSLPARSRAVLWLAAGEGGTARQIAPIVGVSADEVEAIAARGALAVRTKVGLPADAPLRAALSPLVVELPVGLAATAGAWWTAWHAEAEHAKRRLVGATTTVGPRTERLVGAAAATVLAAGVIAALLHDRNTSGKAPTVARPSSGEQAVAADDGSTSAAAPPTTAATAPAATPRSPVVTSPGSGLAAAAAAIATTSAPTVNGGASSPPPSAGIVPIVPSTPSPAPQPTATEPLAAVAVNLADTPIGVSLGSGGVGLQLGATTVGTPPPPPAQPSITIVTGLLPPIVIPLG